MSMARRAIGLESDEKARLGYCALFEKEAFDIDPLDPLQTVIFPEMDETVDVPEITRACWNILGKNPHAIVCNHQPRRSSELSKPSSSFNRFIADEPHQACGSSSAPKCGILNENSVLASLAMVSIICHVSGIEGFKTFSLLPWTLTSVAESFTSRVSENACVTANARAGNSISGNTSINMLFACSIRAAYTVSRGYDNDNWRRSKFFH